MQRNISFRVWLEAMEDDRTRIKTAIVQKIRDMENETDDSEEEILNKSLKNMKLSRVKELIIHANVRNLGNDLVRELLRRIGSDHTAEFTVRELIDTLAGDTDQTLRSPPKTYAPKNSLPNPAQDAGPPPNPAAPVGPPQPSPQAMPATTPMG